MSVSLSGVFSTYASLFTALSLSGNFNISENITSILSAAYAGATAGNVGTSSENPITALQIAQRNQAQDVAAEAKQPQVLRDVAAFTKAVQTATSAKQLLANPAVMKVLLTANGLGPQIGYPALAQQALLSDPNDPTSLANQLATTNTQWLATAQTYDFANKGLSIIQNPKIVSTLANGYAEVLWRQSLDQQTAGLSNALDFVQNAKNFTSTVQILGDPVIRDVVTTALGIPQQIAYQPLAAQEQAITSQFNVASLQDPKFVQSFADRYLTVLQAAAQSNASTSTIANMTSLAVQAQGLVA
ncbi:DUF1217 domain-containing protein [Acidiphilium sp. AL]|uniref:DUF1217 domain-containing protein n=1 Tax=Acidiphilium iwatense TaxID=768198 RepID=A0ABS9DUY8_9PROT|nr:MULTISPECIES: DUF1217 domain-containing protein [Acidiphilium]MCF3946522.1 DUF1217 domain-containing protein [Acidiphilium iwatense]MCU4160423.1 DUF1217 domain-containing protein [Acidiphilium sp. AL]